MVKKNCVVIKASGGVLGNSKSYSLQVQSEKAKIDVTIPKSFIELNVGDLVSVELMAQGKKE